jgi:leucyl aminopeptidase
MQFADMNNIGGKYAGAISAALFLQEFVDNKPYAHIDMAGPVWATKAGATGWGAKLITEWISQIALISNNASGPTSEEGPAKKKRHFFL